MGTLLSGLVTLLIKTVTAMAPMPTSTQPHPQYCKATFPVRLHLLLPLPACSLPGICDSLDSQVAVQATRPAPVAQQSQHFLAMVSKAWTTRTTPFQSFAACILQINPPPNSCIVHIIQTLASSPPLSRRLGSGFLSGKLEHERCRILRQK